MRRSLIALLVLTGCIHYVPRPLDPQVNARALESRRLDDPALREYVERSLGRPLTDWPEHQWDLEELTAAAFYFNSEIAVARAEHASAIAAITTARQRPNPNVNASVEHKATPELTPWVSSFGFDLPLELPSKRRARVEQAVANAEALQARVTVVGWRIRSALRTHLLNTWAAVERHDALQQQLQTEREIVEIFTKRLELGEAAQPELARARIAVIQTQLLIEDSIRSQNEALAGIAAAVGVPESAFTRDFRMDRNLAHFSGLLKLRPMPLHEVPGTPGESLTTPALRETALTGRADVLAALHDYAAAEAALRLDIARQYPDLHLGPAFGWDQGAKTWAIAASAELPVFNRHQGEIGEAIARRDEAAARFNAVQAAVGAAIDLAEAQLLAARRKLAGVELALQDEDKQVASAQKQFQAGEIDRLALRSAELEREAAALARADALADVRRALGTIEDALQRPLGPILRQEEQR